MRKLACWLALGAFVQAGAAGVEEELGGEITLWPEDAGTFCFVNAQSRVAEGAFAEAVSSLAESFRVDIRLVARKDGGFDVRKVPSALRELGAKGGIWLVDDPSLPVTLAAPEDDWGLVNVAALSADAPDAKKFALRLQKFVLRTFANLHGIAEPVMMPGCVTKQAVGIAGVDALTCSTYSPEAVSKVAGYLAKAGYRKCKSGTYYDACEEGWAPAPTNAVQKAIWDRVHALPSEPIRIKPETKKAEK